MEVEDLFKEFNKNKASGKHETVLVLGPPRSGKTFFIDNYLKPYTKAEEYTIGLISKRIQPSNNIIDAFKRVMPWVSKLDYISIEGNDELRKFGNEFIKSLRETFGYSAPKHVIDEIINRAKKINAKSIITYYISWDYKGSIDDETKEALDLITNAFNKYNAKIKWIKAEYIPPGLIREVTELIKTKGKDEAKRTVDEWVDAYTTVLKIAGLDKGEWEESFVISARTFFNTLGARALGTLGYITSITSNIILDALAKTIITLLTFHIFKTPQSAKAGDVIELTAKLAKLKASKPSNELCGEFNELGKLIAYKLATTLGLNVEEVCNALTKISGIDKDRLRSMIDDINKRLTEVEEKVNKLEKRIEMLKQEVRADITVVNRDEFGRGQLYPNIEVEEGELRIKVDIGSGHYRVVEEGDLKTALEKITDKLKNGSTVVLTGPRGIGKSTLSPLAIWRLLDAGEVGLVVRVNELVKKDRIYSFDTFIDNYLKEFRNIFGKLLILYDPSSTEMYGEEGKVSIPAGITDTIEILLKIVNRIKDSPALIILPSDIYNALSEEMKKSLEQYEFKVKLSDVKFLGEIIREYSGKCKDKLNENELNKLASKVAEYEEGYTLIARLVGMELTKSDCNIDGIKRMIEESEHKAGAFIAGIINKWFDVIDDNGEINRERINVLAEILAIRRPFAKSRNPGDPILTKGIVRLIESVNGSKKEMSEEMVNWLTRRSHDLIENTIKRLLDGEDLGEVSRPWRSRRSNSVSKIKNEWEAVKHFIEKYGEEFFKELSNFSDCWRRATLIIGHALTWNLELPDKDKYSNNAIVDILNPCGIDDYLLVDNKIPYFVYALVAYLHISGSSPFARIFANEYKNAIEEAKKLLEIWRRRSNEFEARYAHGLALIFAEAARLGKAINEDDADVILKTTLTAVELTRLTHQIYVNYEIYVNYVKYILEALEPLRDKAPQQYLKILSIASKMEVNKDTFRFIYNEVNYILSNFFNRFMELVWPLATAVEVYSAMLHYSYHFKDEEVGNIVKSMCDLLNALKKESNELATIAEVYVLELALEDSKIRDLISKYCSVKDLVTRAFEVRESLRELANRSDELLKNEYFMNWSTFVNGISQQEIRIFITFMGAQLTKSLAEYKFEKDEFDEASKLSNEAVNEALEALRGVEDWENYIINHPWLIYVLHAKIPVSISGS
jgi:energy-coupling factor transporter ATP-binding protein EcfA2